MVAETSPIVLEKKESPAVSEVRQRSCGPQGFRRLLVAVDESDQAGFAVDAAARLAKQLGAELLLVNVFRADLGFTPEFAFAEPNSRAAAIEYGTGLLDEAKQRASMVHSAAATFLREGDPAEEILDLAIRADVDLIVIGTHGRGRIGHAFLGSVANSVVRRAICPVMMVCSPVP